MRHADDLGDIAVFAAKQHGTMCDLRACLTLAVGLVVASGCAGGIGTGPASGTRWAVAPTASSPTAVTPSFAIPPRPSFSVPPAPSFATPMSPSSTRRASGVAQHAAFFAGEAALGNGVYYLALPNSNPFGYYSYLLDPSYIYHFDAGYEYVVDANDGQGGVYLYDYQSGHWWYTGRTFPFPYVYDFSLNALLYYYPDARPGHYTQNPRWFYDFASARIIPLPDYGVTLDPPSVQLWQASSYTSGNGNCTNDSWTFCMGAPQGNGYRFRADVLPHQADGHSGPWSLSSTDPHVSQAYNCVAVWGAPTANGKPCAYPGVGIAVFGFVPGTATITVRGAHDASAQLRVNDSETTVVIRLVNMNAATAMGVTGNSTANYPAPRATVYFDVPLSSDQTYTIMNFPVDGSTNTITATVYAQSTLIGTATATGILINPTHANTVTLTPH